MKAIADSANWDYLATRIRARRARALAVPAGAPPTIHLQTLQLIEELDTLRSHVDHAAGLIYSCFLERFHLWNILLILRIRANPGRRPLLAPLLVESPHLPPFRLDAMVQTATAAQMTELLSGSAFRRKLLPILREFDANPDLFQGETRLEALFYNRLIESCQALPDDESGPLLRLVGTEIDIINSLILLRNLTPYHLPPDALAALFIKGGRFLRLEALPGLSRHSDRESLVAALPATYRTLIRQQGSAAPLAAVEDTLWAEPYRIARLLFRDYTNPAMSLLVYPFLAYRDFLQGIRRAESQRLGETHV